MTSSEIIVKGIVDSIEKLRQPPPKWAALVDTGEMDEMDYEIHLEKNISYNKALDDVIKLLNVQNT